MIIQGRPRYCAVTGNWRHQGYWIISMPDTQVPTPARRRHFGRHLKEVFPDYIFTLLTRGVPAGTAPVVNLVSEIDEEDDEIPETPPEPRDEIVRSIRAYIARSGL
jgi:hypothetical protein